MREGIYACCEKKTRMSFTRVKREIIGVERNYQFLSPIIPTVRLKVNPSFMPFMYVRKQYNRVLSVLLLPPQVRCYDQIARSVVPLRLPCFPECRYCEY